MVYLLLKTIEGEGVWMVCLLLRDTKREGDGQPVAEDL